MRAMQTLVAIIGFGSIPFAAIGETAAEPDLEYPVPIFAGANYDPDIPTLESLLGFSVGKRIAAPAEIEAGTRVIDGPDIDHDPDKIVPI